MPGGGWGGQRTIWRFREGAGEWRVALSREFVALDTSAYASRADFVGRLGDVLRSVDDVVGPREAGRVGLRYIDRLGREALEHIPEFVRLELLGVIASPLAGRVRHGLTESELELDREGRRLRARWGLLPGKVTIDPALVSPVEDRS